MPCYFLRMAIEQLPLTDPWVQEMLWTHLTPELVRWDYTKLDAIKYIERAHLDGECGFYCDKERGTMLRATVANPKTVIVDIHGNGLRMREFLRECIPIAFRNFRFDIIEVWLIDLRLVHLCERIGFKTVAYVGNRLYVKGEMVDVVVMHYTRKDFEEEAKREYEKRHAAD